MSDLTDPLAALEDKLDRLPVAAPVVPDLTIEGVAAEDRVRVELHGGKVTSVFLHPSLTRESLNILGEYVRDAVNDGLQKQAEAMVEAMQSDATDFGRLRGQLEQVRQEAANNLGKYMDQMTSMLAQASGQGQGRP